MTPISFSAADDAAIRTMRAAGQSWTAVAAALGYAKMTVTTYADRALGLKLNTTRPMNDASPLYRHRALIERRSKRGVAPGDIAEEINDRDPPALATDEMVLQAISAFGFERHALPAGHEVTWGAIAATSGEVQPYVH